MHEDPRLDVIAGTRQGSCGSAHSVGGSSSLRSQVIASSDSPLPRPKAHAAAGGQLIREARDQGDLGNTSCETLSRRVRAALPSLGPSC